MDEYQIRNFLKFAPSRLGLAPKKHLFIHIPKNGGMAIREAPQLQDRLVIANRRRLKSRAYADKLKAFMSERGGNPGYEHARLRDVDMSVRQATRAFAIVRNPWSRTVSRFKFALQTRIYEDRSPEATLAEFETFLEERHEWGGVEFFWHRAVAGWYAQEDYVLDEKGGLAVDILRQEHLSTEMQTYLGFTSELKRRNISTKSRADYRDLYTEKTIQIVADWYAADIDRFGFDFDTPATKSILYAET
ncbi:sulfotransferase family 2 domain-containing protein [uncultured Roseibium sp.]|uniref:sulfotransferase family 2 domain-containing protein n=1 Tax=uncultured Roseibium sp. TaxID=1936171 RepID=UPI00260DBAE1|nr:sulfotransferase family 2 domain-containing protein [uncultured Roseibium sp.]